MSYFRIFLSDFNVSFAKMHCFRLKGIDFDVIGIFKWLLDHHLRLKLINLSYTLCHINFPHLFDYTMQIFVLCWVYLLHVFSLKYSDFNVQPVLDTQTATYSKMVPFAWHLGGKKWPFLVWPIPKVFIFIYLNKWVPEQFRWQPGRLCQWHELEINVEIAIASGVRMCEKMEGLLMI